MPVIACATQLGSRGEEMAQYIAREMGLRYIDREAIVRAAAAAGASDEAIEDMEERKPSALDRITRLLAQYPVTDPLTTYTFQDPVVLDRLDPDTTRLLIEEVVKRLVGEGDAVLIGQGAPYFLRRSPGVLSVYFCASKQFRLDWIMANEGCDKATAERKIKDNDAMRIELVKKYWQLEWLNPAAYDICINTDWYDAEGCLAIVRTAAERLRR